MTTTTTPTRRELQQFAHRFGYDGLPLNHPDLLAHFEREQNRPHLTDTGLPHDPDDRVTIDGLTGQPKPVEIDAPLSPEGELAKLSRDWLELQPRVIAGDPLAKRALTLVEKKLKAVQAKINEQEAERKRLAKEEVAARAKAGEEAVTLGKESYALAKAADDAVLALVREHIAPFVRHKHLHREACVASGQPRSESPPIYGQRLYETLTAALRAEGIQIFGMHNSFRTLASTEPNPNPEEE